MSCVNGILGCALIATGNIIWVIQRKKSAKQNPFTLALVEKGNVAAVAWKEQFALASGLCFVTVAIAVYFSSLRDT